MSGDPVSEDRIGWDLRDEIGYWMRAYGVTQSEIAEAVGCTQAHVSRMLSGRAPLSTAVAERMLLAMGRVGLVSSVSLEEDRALTMASLGEITYTKERSE